MIFKENKAISVIYKWFHAKDEFVLFVICAALGFLNSLLFYHLLDGYQYNFGKNLAGVFIPPVLSVFYLTYTGFNYDLNKRVFTNTLLLYVLQIIPFTSLFFQIFRPTPFDDFERYYLCAKNMFDNNTLWGGDKLFYKNTGYSYVTQPGYRYFIYLELLLFRNLYRIVSFINIALYLVTIFYFQKLIHKAIASKTLRLNILLVILLFTPYVIKNLLMGLPEWLTVMLLMWSSCLYAANRRLTAVFVLGLVPFFRQNLLITVLLLFFWMLFTNKHKSMMLVLFSVPLFLPFYHNLYYAGEWRFFGDIFQYPFLNHANNSIDYTFIANNIIHYFGLDVSTGKPEFSFIALLFLPYATVLYFILVRNIAVLKEKGGFILTTMSTVLPAIFLGSGYYPRFEFVSVAITITIFTLLSFVNNSKQHDLKIATIS